MFDWLKLRIEESTLYRLRIVLIVLIFVDLLFQGLYGSGREGVSKIRGKEKERRVSTRPSCEETKRFV